MRYLLDVNALIAFGHTEHQFYVRVATWAAELARNEVPELATSSITELGFVRVMSQAYGVSIIQSKALLQGLKDSDRYDFSFIADDHDVSKLPSWVTTGKQTTDGHLVELARSNGCSLATLDENISGAFVIP
jgi:predicted nucleic acid-binding protein